MTLILIQHNALLVVILKSGAMYIDEIGNMSTDYTNKDKSFYSQPRGVYYVEAIQSWLIIGTIVA